MLPKRGIRNGDIVKIINELGIVLAGAYVTERIRPSVAYIDHGARVDFIKVGEIDRGGAINTIAPDKVISKNCPGMAPAGTWFRWSVWGLTSMISGEEIIPKPLPENMIRPRVCSLMPG